MSLSFLVVKIVNLQGQLQVMTMPMARHNIELVFSL